MRNILIVISMVVVVVVGIVVIQWFNQVMKISAEDQRQEQIYKEKVQTQLLIEACMQDAYDSYVNDWNTQCRIEFKADDCLLSNYQAQQFDAQLEKDEALCVARFK